MAARCRRQMRSQDNSNGIKKLLKQSGHELAPGGWRGVDMFDNGIAFACGAIRRLGLHSLEQTREQILFWTTHER